MGNHHVDPGGLVARLDPKSSSILGCSSREELLWPTLIYRTGVSGPKAPPLLPFNRHLRNEGPSAASLSCLIFRRILRINVSLAEGHVRVPVVSEQQRAPNLFPLGVSVELIQTEVHHVQTLHIMERVFRQGMLDELQLNPSVLHALFPCLDQLTRIHSHFLEQLFLRRNDSLQSGSGHNFTIHQLGDILLEQVTHPEIWTLLSTVTLPNPSVTVAIRRISFLLHTQHPDQGLDIPQDKP